MAGPAAIERTRQVGGTRQRGGAAELLLDAIAKKRFLARERHGRLELAVGKVFQPFRHAGDANVFLHQIVIGSEIAVSERPIFAVTVLRGGFEIRVAETQTHAPPDVRAAAGHPQAAHPIERLIFGRCVRFLEIIDEPVVVVLAADVELRLNGTRLPHDFRREIAVFQFECRFVFGEIGIGLGASSLQQRDFQARLRQALAGPAAGRAGAHHQDIEARIAFRRHRVVG